MIFLEPSALSIYLDKCDIYYPGIKLWWEKKVEIDQISGKKVVFRVDKFYEVQAIAVVDLEQAKLCHLTIEYAVRGVGLSSTLLNLCIRELKNVGKDHLWCHGPENLMPDFIKWSGAKIVKTLGKFGRTDFNDVEMVLPFTEFKRKI